MNVYTSEVVSMLSSFGSRDVGWHLVLMQSKRHRDAESGYMWVKVANGMERRIIGHNVNGLYTDDQSLNPSINAASKHLSALSRSHLVISSTTIRAETTTFYRLNIGDLPCQLLSSSLTWSFLSHSPFPLTVLLFSFLVSLSYAPPQAIYRYGCVLSST